MRKLVAVAAATLLWLGWHALLPPPADAELQVRITGQVRLNGIWSDRVAPKNSQSIGINDIPFDPDSIPVAPSTASAIATAKALDHSQFTLDARRSRLNIVISDTDPGDIKVSGLVQGYFDTTKGNAETSNSRGFRLRLAYAQATTPGGISLRFGQVRTLLGEQSDNLIGGVADTDVINEFGQFDQIDARQPGIQLSWTQKMGEGDLTVGVSVEKQAVDVRSRTNPIAGQPNLSTNVAED